MTQRIYIPIMAGFILSLFAFGVFWAPNASASSITCANVRCAGTCLDTPGGPVCTPRVTCASTLCEAGNRCEERSSGPVCVPNTSFPNTGVPNTGGPKPYVTPRPYVHPRPYVRHRPYASPRPRPYVRPRPRPYVNPAPQGDNCRTYRDSYRGYGYYRRDCARRPAYRPDYPPAPTPRPEPQMCTMQYDPVCAQKQVQCVRAPCPPITRTFGNACQASVEDFTVLYKGTCSAG